MLLHSVAIYSKGYKQECKKDTPVVSPCQDDSTNLTLISPLSARQTVTYSSVVGHLYSRNMYEPGLSLLKFTVGPNTCVEQPGVSNRGLQGYPYREQHVGAIRIHLHLEKVQILPSARRHMHAAGQQEIAWVVKTCVIRGILQRLQSACDINTREAHRGEYGTYVVDLCLILLDKSYEWECKEGSQDPSANPPSTQTSRRYHTRRRSFIQMVMRHGVVTLADNPM
ncbi:hypothetical protein K504DRAFT_122664 [Pleomassaria siparia CBS 279.74]|uniref:Uncharacterized protein n=1 Tax=Pleomassaria siparia CBS 279.74 TaxID=1314801 RepID=A0A6G1KK49_9PLEO|nr:hypothetical protein K504DRAFT_122664 [Pleomassaria siparia CBS 279.74]